MEGLSMLPDDESNDFPGLMHAHTRDAQRTSALRFRLGAMTLAIPSRVVKAVAERRKVCAVPYRRHTAFLGLVAYGGDILPCCSIARLLGAAEFDTAPATERDARTIILEERAGERWAFPVDAVLGIVSGTLEVATAASALSSEWTEHALRDDSGVCVELLRPDTVFARFARAVG